MNWKNININKQNIETETYKAVLIKMPNNSEYKGYKFWHPSKLVRDGRNKNSISIGYTDEFNFKLVKYGKGKTNKFDVIDEVSIDAEEFEIAFDVMDHNIKSKSNKSYLVVDEPKPIDVEGGVDDCLKNK